MKESKRSVHDVVQSNLKLDSALADALLVKWVLVLEVALPDGSHSVIRMTSDADGHDLFKWEATGLLHTALGNS
jgi:hypothetical protein